MDERTKSFTLVFEGDIRTFKMNPLTTETPWGIPHSAGVGDAFAQCDRFLEALSWMENEEPLLVEAAREKFNLPTS